MEELWKDFKCLKCDGIFKVETLMSVIGWRCKWCDFPHMFKKGQRELECDTIEEWVEDE